MPNVAVVSPQDVADVPTMAEAGVPRPIIDKLNAVIRLAVVEPSVQQRLLQVGARALWSTPEDAAADVA
ncbi:MAG: hypothetical protein IRY87_02035 [Acetobacteraceae bacterium]|nr:hypothetical protein [Acetobacteraceae bacterium]